VIDTNLPPILHRFHVMAECVKFSLETWGRFTLTPSLEAILCEYRHKWYIGRNHILGGIFLWQNVSVYV